MDRGAHRAGACGLALIALAAIAEPAAAQQDTTLAPLLVELRIDRGRSRVSQALSRDSIVLVPLGDFLELAGLPAPDVEAGTAVRGWIEPRHVSFVIDTRARHVARGGQRDTLRAEDVAWQDGALFVSAGVLDRVFAVRAQMMWSELTLLVADADSLPSVRRAGRLLRREAWMSYVPPPAAESLLSLPRAWADGAVLDWAVSGTMPGVDDNAGLRLGLGAQLLGGGVEIQHQSSRIPRGWQSTTTWSWLRAFPGGAAVRQLRAGETMTDGLRPRSVRGAVVSNAPYLRPALYGVDYVRGVLPIGWEAELYQGGRLVSYATLDSLTTFALGLPLVYGANAMEQVVYGPGGEVLRTAREFYVPQERLARGRLEYSVGWGECRADPCDAIGVADLRAGLSSRLTVQGGVEGAWGADRERVRWHPYWLAAFGLTGSLNLIASAVRGGFARGRVLFDPSPDAHVDVEYTLSDTTAAGLLYSGGREPRRLTGALFLQPAFLGRNVQIQASGTFARRAAGSRHSVRGGAALRVGGGRIALDLVQDGERPAGDPVRATSGADGSLQVLLRGPWRALARSLIAATVQSRCEGEVLRCAPRPQFASVAFGRTLWGQVRLDLQARWQRGTRGLSLEAVLTAGWPSSRLVSRTSLSPDGEAVSSQSLEGSVLWDRSRGRLAYSDGRSLGRGGLTGVVFLDLDGDGWKDGDEQALPDVLLRVGSNAVVTDSLGRWSSSDLTAFEPAIVEVDSLSLGNPLWSPVVARLAVSPIPNSFRFVPVPVVEGAEVSGQVLWGVAGRGVGGLRVVMRDAATGARREATTFSDGTFYLLGLPPGTYDLGIEESLLAELRARAETVRFDVGRGGGQRIEGLTLVLERANDAGGR